MTTHTHTHTRGTGLAAAMDAEWQHLRGDATALARWRGVEPELAQHTNLDQLCAAVHDRTNPARSDRTLAALVRLAAVTGHSDVFAARVVLQLLLPGAVRLARSLTTSGGDLTDLTDLEATVFAELTILIRTYPWQRRPRAVAANLLLDCRQRLVRAYHRTRPEVAAGLAVGDHHPAAGQPPESDDPLALQDLLGWAHRHGVLDPFEAQLLVASHVQQIPMAELVTRFGRSRSSLFTIRASAEKRLRHAMTT